MAIVEMVMPKMGESVMEGTVLTWLKQVGDTIEQDESVLEVATDKVDTEVPAPYSGVLKEILAQEGEVVQVDHAIARIEVASDETPAETPAAPTPQADSKPAAIEQAATNNGTAANGKPQDGRFYSPLVLSIAKNENIPLAELEGIAGTGKEGRVTKNDMLAYVENRKGGVGTLIAPPSVTASPVQKQQPVHSPAPVASTTPTVSLNGSDEIIEMDRMRKMIAERMVESKRISPHVTSFVEADVTNIVKWRNQNKKAFQERYEAALTFTPIFMDAIIRAIHDYPMINISVDGGRIIQKKNINIGLAVALPSGNLIVPVIHNADHLSLSGLALKVNELAKRARENKLKPDELQGGTYTVSNVGSFGNVMGTPIILQPQVAIMALGAVRKKPAVIETPEGDFIGIRNLMFLSHSYDHRVVDGALGGMFVRRVADYLESFELSRPI